MSLLLALATGGGLPPLVGALALTDGADSVVASASVSASAALARTDAADPVVAAGAVKVAASLARTDAADVLSASGLVAASVITGQLSLLLDGQDAVTAAAAAAVVARLTRSDGADPVAVTGAVAVVASASLFDGNDPLQAVGGSFRLASLSVLDGNDLVAAAGVVTDAPPADEVVSLGGGITRLWRDYQPPMPEIKAKLWRLDDDDTVRASAGFVEIVRAAALAVNDGDDRVQAVGRVVRIVLLVRDNPKAALVRTVPQALLRRAA